MTGLEMLLLIVVAGYTTKALVTDGAAAVRGQTPPSQQRWEQRQKQRQSRGQKPAAEPGYLGRIWRNATAEWAERNAHRHTARMDYITEREPQKSAKWKERKLARAEKWDTARAKAAERGGLAWQQIKDGTGTVRQAVGEHRAARKAAAGRLADAQPPTGEQVTAQVDPAPSEPGQADLGKVLPFSRPDAGEPGSDAGFPGDQREIGLDQRLLAEAKRGDLHRYRHHGDAIAALMNEGYLNSKNHLLTEDGERELARLEAGGNPRPDTFARGPGLEVLDRSRGAAQGSTDQSLGTDRPTDNQQHATTPTKEAAPMAQQPTGEIENLSQATAFCEQMAAYFESLTGQFEPVRAQAKQAAQDLGQAPQIFENGQSALTAHGFGTQVTGPMAAASESASAAGEAVRAAEEAIAVATERIAEAAAQSSTAGQQLSTQQGLADQVQSHRASGVGVASSTEFYSNA
jgi:hypothetical protein